MVAFTAPDRATARRSFRWGMATILLGMVLVAWQCSDRALTAVGAFLTIDDPLAPVEMIVLSLASGRADAIEVARLYHQGISRRIVLARWQKDGLDDDMRRLGIPWPAPHELATMMLERSGVPSESIEVLEGPIDGLNTEVTTIAAFARETHPASLLYVTARTHTHRAQLLLRRLLPPATELRVRSPDFDDFEPANWWHTRGGTREVAMEYLRWANTFGLRDLWRHASPPSVPEPID